MNKILLFEILVFVLFSFSCNKSGQNIDHQKHITNETDTIDHRLVEFATSFHKGDTIIKPITEYHFKLPSKNFIFFATEDSLFYLDEYKSKPVFVVDFEKIYDFFVAGQTVILASYDGDNLRFYKFDIQNPSPQKVFVVDTNEVKYFDTEWQYQYQSLYSAKIVGFLDNKIFVNFYFYVKYAEPGPTLPFIQTVLDLNTGKLSVNKNIVKYAYCIEEDTSMAQKQADGFKFYADSGLLFRHKIVITIDELKRNAPYGEFYDNSEQYFVFSPDKTVILWFISTFFMEGNLYDAYYINLVSGTYFYFFINEDRPCLWTDNNAIVYRDVRRNLNLLGADNIIYQIKSNVIRFMPQYNIGTKHMFTVY